MTATRPYRDAYRLSLIWIVIFLVAAAGCGSRQTAPQGPPVDRDLERTNRAARSAFGNGRFQQAADLYQQTLERAYLRDDLAAAIDARYNLALCLTLLDSDHEAFAQVKQAREALSRAGRPVPEDILLLEGTILYRLGKYQEAWQLTEDILKVTDTKPSDARSKTHFLRGLIASERRDLPKLRKEITALANSNSPVIRADREELVGHLSLAERRWQEAILAFDEAAVLRRQQLDYRGMVKALAKAGEACERAGSPVQASRRYLRAGQSSALQGNADQAQLWLIRAVRLAEQVGDKKIAREARLHLTQLQEGKPDSSADSESAKEGP